MIDHGLQQLRAPGKIILVIKQRPIDRFCRHRHRRRNASVRVADIFEYGAELLQIGNVAMLERAPFDRPNVTA